MGNICTNSNNEEMNKLSYNLSTPIINKDISTNVSGSLNETNNMTLLKTNPYNKNHNINIDINNYCLNKKIFVNNKVTLINSVIKGFLLRKKYKEYLKLDLMDFTNELYFQYLSKTKNKKVSKIINNDKNKEIIGYLRTNWSEFYNEDPNKDINIKINKCKKYINGLIFIYKDKNFHSDSIEICLKSVIYCYKGSVDIYTNKKCGYGELVFLDGSQKLGTFYNDEFIGWNTYVNSEGALYVGYFSKNKLNGKGLKYIPEKEHIYRGDFVDGMRHGYGKDYRKNSKYEGQFSFDKKNGKGEIVLNTGDVYKGEFKNNKITGFGHYIWKNNYHEYIGNFLNGKFHGEGFYKWGNNQYFKGKYINGVKEGKGEIGFNDGKKCFINFINGKPYGKGTLIDSDGNIIEAEFESGKLKNNDEAMNE
jgi:hypothetical protein